MEFLKHLKALASPSLNKFRSKKTKFYQEDFSDHFNVYYLERNKIMAPELKTWDITQDEEFANDPDLNYKLEKKYGPLIDQAYHAKMCIKWINKTVQYGAFAEQDIKRGDMVVEYTGLLEEDKKDDTENLYVWDYPTIIYKKQPGKVRRKKIKYCVNAEKYGNYARFINHSLRKYQNVAIQMVPRKKFWHVVYVAQKDIKKGQQLLTYYGLDYWRDCQIVPAVIAPDTN